MLKHISDNTTSAKTFNDCFIESRLKEAREYMEVADYNHHFDNYKPLYDNVLISICTVEKVFYGSEGLSRISLRKKLHDTTDGLVFYFDLLISQIA